MSKARTGEGYIHSSRSEGLLIFQGFADGATSTRLVLGVLVAIWILGLGVLLIHISRTNAPATSDRVIDLDRHRRVAGRPSSANGAAVPAATHGSPAVIFLTTSVVPAQTASEPVWDAQRGAWVSQHPDFGLLVLNAETNRWRAG